jgi:hypothetical protein
MTKTKTFWLRSSADAFAADKVAMLGLNWSQWDIVTAHTFGPRDCFSIGWKVRWVEGGGSLDVSK